jgi:hypothetical protein
MNGHFEKAGLLYDFDVTAKLEVFYGNSWIETSPEMFRSWTGLRKLDGQEFRGTVYAFLDNSKELSKNKTQLVK